MELATYFYADVPGQVQAIRFYKSSANTGTHLGHLWTISGKKLAEVTFSGESTQGWQTAALSTPVSISANTLYVVSYTAPNGRYSSTPNFFTSQYPSGVLHSTNGGSVDYVTGVQSPSATNNYFADLVFAPSATAAYASSTTVSTGSVNSGSFANLGATDSQQYKVASSRPSLTNTVDWYATFNNVPRTLTSVAANFTGTSTRSCNATLSFYNWTTSSWVPAPQFALGSSQLRISSLKPAGAAGDYVSGASSQGSVRVKVSCSTTSGTFTASTDALYLSYTN